uniref:Uncharacterized protein n=1 Tax=Cannabis sativa TaxID=3483 RepID=A0A803NPT8_CANSA
MNSFNIGLWKIGGTLKGKALNKNNRELTCLNGLEKLIALIVELLPVEVFMSWKEDPLPHIHYFNVQTDLQGVRDNIEPNDLVDVKQLEDEPLNDYIQQFFEAAAKTKSLGKDARVMALVVGLKEMSSMWPNLHLKVVYTMNDFLDIVDGFIKLEEDVTRTNGLNGVKKKSPDIRAPTTEAQGNGKKRSLNRGKRADNGGKQGNSLGGKKPKTGGKLLREHEPCITTYFILLAQREENYTAT